MTITLETLLFCAAWNIPHFHTTRPTAGHEMFPVGGEPNVRNWPFVRNLGAELTEFLTNLVNKMVNRL